MSKYIFLVLLLFPLCLHGQTITGKVVDDNGEPVVRANVFWLETNVGVFTESDGTFEIRQVEKRQKLSASYVGYEPDTVHVSGPAPITFTLGSSKTLEAVVVKGERPGVIISNIDPIKTQQITQTELRKAACCDLAGCFESQLTVQPQTTNIITNSKELRILGLSGVYNQVLIDGFPVIQGLSYTYGISSVPGTLVDNIFVAKGANSVLQGFESISGQINVLTKSADNTDKLLLNVYMNSFLEKQFNANLAYSGKKWSNLIALHTAQPGKKTDRDNDHFLDLPLITRYSVSEKFKYRKDTEWGWSSTIGVKLMNEKRVGGQTFFDPENDRGSAMAYGQTVNINHAEILTKTNYRFNDTHGLVLHMSAFHQDQESYFGTTKYLAGQNNFYGNLQYELNYGKAHELKTGVSYRYLNLDEDISFTENSLERTFAGEYKKTERIPGSFVENTLRFFDNKLTWIAGIRGDHHNQFGFSLTPRTLLKYNVTPQAVIRANIGTGWRTVNLFSENINLLVSSRNIIFAENLRPEKALNMGINYTQNFGVEKLSGYISADFYHTAFQNQIFPDYDTAPTQAIIQNFTGTSTSNGFQLEVFLNILERFEWKSGYTFLDVYRMVENEKQALPFNASHKFLTTFSYKPLSRKFHLDINMHWYGTQRLPDTQSSNPAFQRPDHSDPYTIVNAQFTYKFKRFEVYTGCENILDFRQERPIISWEDPFGPNFDTSFAWGPTRGREVYLGLRYKIEKD